MTNKKGLSPLVATFLLVVFALLIGTVAMAWGKNYVPPEIKEKPAAQICVSVSQINTPLKELQVKHITGQISQEQYVEQEKGIVSS